MTFIVVDTVCVCVCVDFPAEHHLLVLTYLGEMQWHNYVRRGEAAASGRLRAPSGKGRHWIQSKLFCRPIICFSILINIIPQRTVSFSQIFLPNCRSWLLPQKLCFFAFPYFDHDAFACFTRTGHPVNCHRFDRVLAILSFVSQMTTEWLA